MKLPAQLALVCAAACAEPRPPPPVASVPNGGPVAHARASPNGQGEVEPRASPAEAEVPRAAEPCDDRPGPDPVRVSCDGARFVLAHPIELHPDRPVPAEPSRGVLHALGDLLQARADILLVRIEVYVGNDPGKDPEKRRIALGDAQRRADAIFSYLWRKRGISAERLEAVAYEHELLRGEGMQTGRWPVVLRIVQRARR